MISVATFGSHCALQVLKGANDEGLKTILICKKDRKKLYQRFSFIDKFILVDDLADILEKKYNLILKQNNTIIVPHGTFITQLSPAEIESINIPIFGNKCILRWESDRIKKEKLMLKAKLNIPNRIPKPSDIKKLSIVKKEGAAGGKGYFLTSDEIDYNKKLTKFIAKKLIKNDEKLYIQEYMSGVLVYLQYFYSPLKKNIEFFGIDRRHESNIDGLARIPATSQNDTDELSFNVIGNSPMVLRESLLTEVYNMGERFIAASKKLVPPGMIGPFCIEGVYDYNTNFTAFEFSARIVAGTNVYMNGSPYSTLLYNEPMSMGRRISREIKNGLQNNNLSKITT